MRFAFQVMFKFSKRSDFMTSNFDKMRLRVKQRIASIESFNKEMKHNFLVISNSSISYTGDWYGPPDPQPGRETFSYMTIMGFETIEQVQDYLLDETKDNPNKVENYTVISAQFLEIKTSVSVSVK